MTHPTDDELEAMAVRLDVDDPWCQPLCYEAAAMLRACKVGDAPDHSDWNAISFLADHNGEAYLREIKLRKAAEQALAEMTRRRDRWRSIAEGQDFTRVYLETCAERDAHKARAEAAEDAIRAAFDRLDRRHIANTEHQKAKEILRAFLASLEGDKP